jgi:hypothetical protein
VIPPKLPTTNNTLAPHGQDRRYLRRIQTEPNASAISGDHVAPDGEWVVNTDIGSFGDFFGSFVGYRVQEELVGIGGQT